MRNWIFALLIILLIFTSNEASPLRADEKA